MSDSEKSSSVPLSRDEVRILVIEDDADVRALVRMTLQRAGFGHIEEATDGAHGARKIQHKKFDLVLLDWQMPEMSGMDLLLSLKNWDEQLPVIMLTAQANADRVKEAIQAGVSDYVVKPFNGQTLVSKINGVIIKLCAA